MSSSYLSILPKVFPLLVLLIMGYIIKKKRFLSSNTISEIKSFLLNISLPALLFTAFLDIEFKSEYLIIIILILFINIFMLYIGKKISPLLKTNDPYLKLMFTGFEMGMLGIPLFTAIYGVENVKYIGIIDIGHELFIWFILLGILFKLRQEKKSTNYKKLFKSFINSPVILAIFLGIILNYLGLDLIKESNIVVLSIMRSIELLAGLTVPLILIIIGYEVEFNTSNIALPLKIIGLRLLFLIPLSLIISKYIYTSALNMNYIYSIALFTMLTMPPPFIIPLFINEKDLKSKKYIFNTLSLGTIISIIIFLSATVFFM